MSQPEPDLERMVEGCDAIWQRATDEDEEEFERCARFDIDWLIQQIDELVEFIEDSEEGRTMTTEAEERNSMPNETQTCSGCGRVDPCGYHYEDCVLLEPGDGIINRETEEVVGYHKVSEEEGYNDG